MASNYPHTTRERRGRGRRVLASKWLLADWISMGMHPVNLENPRNLQISVSTLLYLIFKYILSRWYLVRWCGTQMYGFHMLWEGVLIRPPYQAFLQLGEECFLGNDSKQNSAHSFFKPAKSILMVKHIHLPHQYETYLLTRVARKGMIHQSYLRKFFFIEFVPSFLC